MNTPRKTTRKLNTVKIKELFKGSGKSFEELADAIGGVSSRTLRRMAEEKDVRVSKSALDNVQKHFNLSLNELYIPDDDKISSSHVILYEISNLSDLFENKSYRDLRYHYGHRNIRTLRHYDLEITNDNSSHIQKLIHLALSKNSLLRNSGHSEEDIKQELEYIENLEEGNDALTRLRRKGVYLYYGNYQFKGIEVKYLDNKNITDDDIKKQFSDDFSDGSQVEIWSSEGKLIPTEIKFEVFYFKEFFVNYTVPSNYKIYPSLGYTEKQLTDIYLQALKKNKFNEGQIGLVKKWIEAANNLDWYIKDKTNSKHDDEILWMDRYLTSDYYIDYSSENQNIFKFFTKDAESYNGNFEKVVDYPWVRKLKFNYPNFYEETVNQDDYKKEVEDAMKS